jgi:hypothetical protein
MKSLTSPSDISAVFAPDRLCIWCRASWASARDVFCEECAAIADDRVADWLDQEPFPLPAADTQRPAA